MSRERAVRLPGPRVAAAFRSFTRSLLGVGNDPADLPAGGGLGAMPAVVQNRAGWSGYAAMRGRPGRYRG
ncbi:MAG: hypothetical protein ABR571_01835 [Jatrophihabitans sp.]|uniref:hypothetical protein n=1 Tax=Jatrophihabitans sp. TaxID=1932789 RepID=UPI00390EE80B